MTQLSSKPPILIDHSQQESVIKYAMEKCLIQLENHTTRLNDLRAYREACEAGIREAKYTCNSAAQIREFQLHILQLEQEIDAQRVLLETVQQQIEQYQQRLRVLHGTNQLNEMKAAIKSVELRLQQSVSRFINRSYNRALKPGNDQSNSHFQHTAIPGLGASHVKK